MRNRKPLFTIVLALCIAVAGTLITYRWLMEQASRTPTEAEKKAQAEVVPIAVAAVDLAWGTQVVGSKLDKMFIVKPYLKESLPSGSFTNVASLEGRVFISPVTAGEPILESTLAPVDVAAGGISSVVKPGFRALAVKGNKVIGLAGFIRPGHRVDVLATLEAEGRGNRDITKVVLENVLVLATGSEMVEDHQGNSMPVDVYTLEVTPEDGEKLALADAKGKLQFALRNPTDNEKILTKGATLTNTLASLRNAGVKRDGRVVPSRSVEVIKGTSVSSKTFY